MQFDPSASAFGVVRKTTNIPAGTSIVFVADMFASDYPGGAELTSEALIESSPFNVFKLHAKDVTLELLEKGHALFWIFGNFAQLNKDLIPTIVANMRYSILEFDFKYCIARSPELHESTSGKPCNCHDELNGKMVSAFFYGARSLWWMSEKQRAHYHKLFPFLAERPDCVLSSVFDDDTFATVKLLRDAVAKSGIKREGYVCTKSPSWIKGADASQQWCRDNGKECEAVWGMSRSDLLKKLSTAEGYVCLPPGGDTCPREVIEAHLLGCKLVLNDNVMHKDEEWFTTDDMLTTESYLYAARERFWDGIHDDMNWVPKISGYTTTRNCVKQEYPLMQCIKSMRGFCDEICIVDGGSTDGTLPGLVALAYPGSLGDGTAWDFAELSDIGSCYEFPDEYKGHKRDPQIRVKVVTRDWSDKRFALFDGMQKAEARKMCTGDFCWQMDCDEIVHENDYSKIRNVARNWPGGALMIALPVVEFWGGPDKVRADVHPPKWRLSKNTSQITHGVPREQRRYDECGEMYSAGSDGCDPIFADTGEPVPFLTFYKQEDESVRQAALAGGQDSEALKKYEIWFNTIVDQLPVVYHYSWFDLPRKIRLYRDYWSKHWQNCFGEKCEDTTENNMFFDCPWSEVTDEMIEIRAKELEICGGHVFHSKWNGKTINPCVTIRHTQPAVMLKKGSP